MAKNKLTDLNNHLFAQLERLGEEGLNEDQIKSEVTRSKAICGIASQVVKSAKVTIDAMKLVSDGNYPINEVPKLIGLSQSED